MAENSKIDWTDDTCNCWLGCIPVKLVRSDGTRIPSECDNCYAEWLVANRMGYNGRPGFPVLWGNPKTTPRIQTKYWRGALRKWNRKAQVDGRTLVFEFSLSDWAEEHPMVGQWREEWLSEYVDRTPYLDHLLLTKRIQNVERMVPDSWVLIGWPENVWIGTSTGTDEALRVRLPHLAHIRDLGAPVRFLSIEPQLEDLTTLEEALASGVVNWCITGGESGPDAGYGDRPRIDADPAWFRRVRDLCLKHEVPFFHKQSGGRRPGTGKELDGRLWHQWPDTKLGSLGGVRALPGAELIPVR